MVPVSTVIPYIVFLGLYLIGFIIIYTAKFDGNSLDKTTYGITVFQNNNDEQFYF